MNAFSPTLAATEGFRLMRREPKAVLVWMLLWLAALTAAAAVSASGERIVVARHPTFRSLSGINHSFGPFAAVFVGLFLLVWATTTVAAYRAVLRPADRRCFFLRLGADELRVAAMTVTAFVLVLAFGGAPAYLLYVLVSPIMRALPTLAREIATGGALVTVCLDVWLGVRLSLIAVETFAERRFHLTAYWPVTGGRFWYLFLCYFVFFLMFFVLTLLSFGIGGFLFETALVRVGAGDMLRRTSVLGLAGALAVLTVAYWVVSSTLFCACQAHAFRAIVGEGKAGVEPS
ncbi:MAG: hypothetical protein ACR2FH_01260 [Caulobacteraceae bacterium]